MIMSEDERVRWGEIIAEDDDYKLYSSYSYRGVQYRTYDSVYTFSAGSKETDIGKILMIKGTEKEKKVKISWFFRPRDICNFLRDYRPSWNELFLGCGSGKGLSSFVPLEAILGKCDVICTAKDHRVMLPSKSDVAKADYFFSHVFDVDTRKLSGNLPDTIGSVRVERFLNRGRIKPKANVAVPVLKTEDAGKPYSSDFQRQTSNGKVIVKKTVVKEETNIMFEQPSPETQALKRRKISELGAVCTLKPKSEAVDEVDDEANDAIYEKPLKPAAGEHKWLCKLPWEQNIAVAHEQRRLVTISNLDPSLTSSEVQDMISTTFNLTVDAKIIPHRSFSNPLHGQALVIFNTMDEANFVISELNKKCLVDDEGRPVVAFKTKLVEPPKANYFPGHITLQLYEKKKRTTKAKAVATSHCAQSNTSETQMAEEWQLFHQLTDLWCKSLHEEQEREIAACMSKLKSRQPSDLATVSGKNSLQAAAIQNKTESALCGKDGKDNQASEHSQADEPYPELASGGETSKHETEVQNLKETPEHAAIKSSDNY